jgi:NADH-quinone oxidoreductase subunit M
VSLPLLSLLLLTPALGALLLWPLPAQGARWVALGSGLVTLGLAVGVLLAFDPAQGGFQLLERSRWIPTLNAQYLLGVDGISVLFLPLTALLCLGVILTSWNAVSSMARLYYALLLFLQSATLGIFCALDLMLFFLFWELTLIPLYFLISLWGVGPNRRFAAVNYTLFMLAGGIPLLFGFLLLGFNHAEVAGLSVPAGLSWDYRELLATPMPDRVELGVFLLLLLGFAAKTPLFPLHTWLPLVGTEGPAGVTALITGLKLGAYGLLRFAVGLAPGAAQELHWLLAGLGVVGMLYGAVVALAQTNLRRMLAYSSISHVGLVVLGIASLNLQGLQGALFQLLNFVVVAGGLFLLTAMLRQRTGSTDLVNLGGAARSMPLLASFFFLLGLASMGIPGTNGFPAELLILLGVLESHLGAGLAALIGLVVGASYFLKLYRGTFLGPVHRPGVGQAVDLKPRELLVAGSLALVVLITGLYPQGVIDVTRAAADRWVARVQNP